MTEPALSEREQQALRVLLQHELFGEGGSDLTAAGVAWAIGFRGERLGHAAGPWLASLRRRRLVKATAGRPPGWRLTRSGFKAAELLS